MTLGVTLVGLGDSWVVRSRKAVDTSLSGAWTFLMDWHEPFRVGWCGTDAGERKDDNAMGSVAGITKGCGWAPFANLLSCGRPSGISIVQMSRAA